VHKANQQTSLHACTSNTDQSIPQTLIQRVIETYDA
jgi:hypothetical protein